MIIRICLAGPELIMVWEDPHIDPSVSPFYYARVIEIRTRGGQPTTPSGTASPWTPRSR
jgi:hypothetical protein